MDKEENTEGDTSIQNKPHTGRSSIAISIEFFKKDSQIGFNNGGGDVE